MAQLIIGKEIAKEVRGRIKVEVDALKQEHGLTPGLAVVQVGNREDSNVYVNQKMKFAKELGMKHIHMKLPPTYTQDQILSTVQELNADESIHGIIVQLPLECDNPVDASLAINAVAVEKDVDGINDVNAGRLARGELGSCFVPCTPNGCLELIRTAGFEIKGSNAVVLGRSKIVGSPMANLLTWHHATVTICHSRTRDLKDVVRSGDLVIAAVGVPEMVKGDWIKPGAVVIDCGITAIPDASKKSGQRLVGDVDFAACRQVAGHITPVPGGVGPMTVAMLLHNTMLSCKRVAAAQQPVALKSGFGIPLKYLKTAYRLATKIRF